MRLSVLSISLLVTGLVIGCSDVGFETKPSSTCVKFNGDDRSCDFTPNGNIYTVNFKTGLIDILIVNDNSRSMYTEQVDMANAFSGFLNNIDQFDYNIAMVTTDIYKDEGKLLTFGSSGKKVLSKSSGTYTENLNLFKDTIKREETLNCEQGAECPSNDERGIHAATLAIQKNEGKWLRPGAHTVIIALSDESQRSETEWDASIQDYEGALTGKKLESMDRPETLVSTFHSKFASKSLAVHPIIVKPGDSYCKSQQDGQGGNTWTRGFYGYLWKQLSQAGSNFLATDSEGNARNVLSGNMTSICSNSYSDLNLIGSYAESDASRNVVQMQCLPNNIEEDIDVVSSQPVNYDVNEAKKQIIFNNLPPGIEVEVSWICGNDV